MELLGFDLAGFDEILFLNFLENIILNANFIQI
jgi:hypothetical protein